MTLTRKQKIFSLVGVIGIVVVAYAGWYFLGQKFGSYHGLTTSMTVDMDEATRTYFANRLATEEAAIDAAEAKGEDVDMDLYFAAADDAYSLGDLVTARQNIELQLQGNSANYTAWDFYGTVLEAMGDYDGARTAYLKAIDSGAKVEEFYRDYVTLLENHYPSEQSEIKRILELSVTERGQSSWNMVELGRWYVVNGDCQRAIDHYNVAVALSPQNQDIKDELLNVQKTCKK